MVSVCVCVRVCGVFMYVCFQCLSVRELSLTSNQRVSLLGTECLFQSKMGWWRDQNLLSNQWSAFSYLWPSLPSCLLWGSVSSSLLRALSCSVSKCAEKLLLRAWGRKRYMDVTPFPLGCQLLLRCEEWNTKIHAHLQVLPARHAKDPTDTLMVVAMLWRSGQWKREI